MLPSTLAEAIAHAEREYPREACGLVVIQKGRERFWACRNIETEQGKDRFRLAPDDWAAAEESGEIVRVIHSHPDLPALPSDADLVGCENSGVPWTILGIPSGAVYSWEPTGYQAPLVGRTFHHGILDCYTLCRDYYRLEHGIELPNYDREDEWWLKGQTLYLDHFQEAGFFEIEVADLRRGDAVLMSIGSPHSPTPNHAAVYLGDQQILQHLQDRLSSRDIFGGYFMKCTTHFLRHEALK